MYNETIFFYKTEKKLTNFYNAQHFLIRNKKQSKIKHLYTCMQKIMVYCKVMVNKQK